MSGLSTQGVGAAAWANADVVSAVSAAAIKRVFVEDLVVIIHAPSNWLKKFANGGFLNKPRTPFVRQYAATCDLPRPASQLCCRSGIEGGFSKCVIGMIR